MAKIVLINPRIGIYTKVFKPFLPLSLLAASTLADQQGHEIIIFDQHLYKNWESELKQTLLQHNPVLVGITSMTGTQLKGALRAAQIVRETSHAPIVWGGVHASLFPEGTLEHPNVDYIVAGEGETALVQLMESISNRTNPERIDGIGYKENGILKVNPRGRFHDLDEIPDIPYRLTRLQPYLHTYFWEKSVIEIESSRGCPYNCGFCYNEKYNSRKWRARSPDRIVALIRMLINQHGITNFLFIDDSFFVDLERVNETVRLLLKEPYQVKMGFQGRISSVLQMKDEDLDRLVQAGAVFFQFGVESGSPRILELINKKLTLQQVELINSRMKKYKSVSTFYNFMVGLPTETREEVLQTVDVAWSLLASNPQAYLGTIHLYKEYPGTPLFQYALNEGFKPPQSLEEWAQYDWQSVVTRSADPELTALCRAVSAASYCVDKKIDMLGDSRIASIISAIYRPIARFRFKNKFFKWMPESRIF